mgnify:CR=1 FL=1
MWHRVCVWLVAGIKPWERHVAEKQVGGFMEFSDSGQRCSERVESRETAEFLCKEMMLRCITFQLSNI